MLHIEVSLYPKEVGGEGWLLESKTLTFTYEEEGRVVETVIQMDVPPPGTQLGRIGETISVVTK
jgi:hypothetical protein